MISLVQIPVTLMIVIGVLLAFVGFVGFTMVYLRYYFNRYEPVYTMNDYGHCEKNHIASRFCKIILSNTITDQCLNDIDNVGLWMLTSNVILEWENDVLLSVVELHTVLLAALKDRLDVVQYEKLHGNFIKLELMINSNLMKSKIATPPYLRSSTYALWVTRVLSTLNRS